MVSAFVEPDRSTTGECYYRHRMYHAQLGRFGSRDPVGYEGGVNLFRYVLNNPLIYVDATGEQAIDACPICGPDISVSLTLMDNRIRHMMLIMDPAMKTHACASMFSSDGWDIPILVGHQGPSVEGCPSDNRCNGTVTVDGKCFDHFAVNYYLFGLLNKLCGNGYAQGAAYVVAWSNIVYGHAPGAKSVWYCKGYYGRFAPACNWQPDHSRGDCGLCGKTYPGRFRGHFGKNPSVEFPGE